MGDSALSGMPQTVTHKSLKQKPVSVAAALTDSVRIQSRVSVLLYKKPCRSVQSVVHVSLLIPAFVCVGYT